MCLFSFTITIGYWQGGVILLTSGISGLQGLYKGTLYRLS